MTILQPKKSDRKFNKIVIYLAIAISTSALLEVFLYNQIVNLRHEVNKYKTTARDAEVINAELKSGLYEATDQKKMQAVLENGTLVFDKNPEYLKKQQLVSR